MLRCCLLSRDVEHDGVSIDPDDATARPDATGKIGGDVAAAAAGVEAGHSFPNADVVKQPRRRLGKDPRKHLQAIAPLFSGRDDVVFLGQCPRRLSQQSSPPGRDAAQVSAESARHSRAVSGAQI
jgi:hypothetical protein